MRRMGMAVAPETFAATEHWLSQAPSGDAFFLLDLAYLELRDCPWAYAQSYVDPPLLHFSPFISRRSITAMFELPIALKKTVNSPEKLFCPTGPISLPFLTTAMATRASVSRARRPGSIWSKRNCERFSRHDKRVFRAPKIPDPCHQPAHRVAIQEISAVVSVSSQNGDGPHRQTIQSFKFFEFLPALTMRRLIRLNFERRSAALNFSVNRPPARLVTIPWRRLKSPRPVRQERKMIVVKIIRQH